MNFSPKFDENVTSRIVGDIGSPVKKWMNSKQTFFQEASNLAVTFQVCACKIRPISFKLLYIKFGDVLKADNISKN